MKQFLIKYKIELIVFAIYTLIAAIFFYPVIFHLKSYMFGFSGDPFYNLWLFKNLSGVDLIVNYPFGLENPGHILIPNYPILDLLGKTLTQLFSSEIVAYNLIILFSFPLSGIAIYLILKEITNNKYASFLGGLIYTFCAYHFARAQMHINLVDIYWLPFNILFLIKIYKYSKLRDYIILGIILAITLLDHYQYGVAAALCTLIFVIAIFTKNKISRLDFLKKISLSAIISIIIIALFIPWLFKGNITSQTRHFSFDELKVYSARWFNYYLPIPESYLFGKYTENIYTNDINKTGSNITEETLFLGWTNLVLLILSLYLIFKNKKDDIFKFSTIFIIITLVGLIFSFAPEINILGLKIKTPAYYIFNTLPVFRVYSRFGILVILSISVLSSIGFYYLIKNKKISLIITTIILLLVLAESIQKPFINYQNISTANMPKVYEILQQQPIKPVAEYPLLSSEEPKSYDYLLWQRYHKFPLVYGAPQDTDGDKLRKDIIDPSNSDTISRLISLQVKYIIIHKDKFTPENAKKYPREYNNGQIPNITDNRLTNIYSDQSYDLYALE